MHPLKIPESLQFLKNSNLIDCRVVAARSDRRCRSASWQKINGFGLPEPCSCRSVVSRILPSSDRFGSTAPAIVLWVFLIFFWVIFTCQMLFDPLGKWRRNVSFENKGTF
ncbi:hypothetical protein L596_015701 [Steinernema carpocapsae]|uniref:Uncharacterized protein n=1 Tax=Steinernema carpocapsae TaxID=34508 RepID=A0A4U5NGF0_STECR|nr:hypothetical protein L596_015701 [Steinernema carpocapsae]